MSDINISVQEIKSVHAHPNADKLEIVKVLGTQTIVGKGEFKAGDKVIYFPPDMMIPETVSQQLGVQKYLKHAVFNGEKIQCRIAACRLRGVPSYGFVVRAFSWATIGADWTDQHHAQQYVPPMKTVAGDAAPGLVDFPRYTNIQHYWRYPDAIPEGTPVRITEKLHGTNSRVGIVQVDDEWTLVAGSHNLRIKPPADSSGSRRWHSRYWLPLENDNLREMLTTLSGLKWSVVIYGEIFGPGIQDMDYGLSQVGYRVYDIMVDGSYLDWDQVEHACHVFGIPTVPLLYTGPLSAEVVERYTCGPSAFDGIKGKFKGREGIVITSLTEAWTPQLQGQGRMILKSVSADYLNRKGAQDNE
jgi:RNA ligase (TIGR02306 family)